jgi:hypothetical protein
VVSLNSLPSDGYQNLLLSQSIQPAISREGIIPAAMGRCDTCKIAQTSAGDSHLTSAGNSHPVRQVILT